MKKIKFIIILLTVAAFVSSCQEEFEPEMIPGHELAGEWYVTYTVGGDDIYGVGYTTLLTYTSAKADGSELWVTDNAHFWDFKAKVAANPESMSFGQTDSTMNMVDGYPINMIVKSGKVIEDGGKSRTGVTVDSIYMVVGFGDDTPGMEYVVSGHRRTGFLEDDF